MKQTTSLISAQEAAIARISEPRSSKLRQGKNTRAAIRRLQKDAMRLGYTTDQITTIVQDTLDVLRLRLNAEEA